jgi:CheY-like chemotaxis protein
VATILLLDDSPLVLNATQAALEAGGHRVVTTSEPPEFFAALAREQPALALVDVSMPTLEGDAVVWITRAHNLHDCSIYLYSAKSEAELKRLVASSGADGFLCKTSDDALLRKQVDEALARRA